ncbi:NACHT domain-containing protein [Actinoplanes xinjiangensis]|nr:NACHT domain-containing protein [Actinoplanes xinjiangensis]
MWLVLTASDDQKFNRLVGFSNIFAFVVGVFGLLVAALGIQQSNKEAPAEAAITSILRNQIGYYDGAGWTKRAIQLFVQREGVGRASAATTLKTWSLSSKQRAIILTGEFGCGKTWVLLRLARDLAKLRLRHGASIPFPVYLSLGRLAHTKVSSKAELMALAFPTPISLADGIGPGEPILMILDGIDEMVNVSGANIDRVKALLSLVSQSTSRSTRFVVGCRAQTLGAVRLSDELELALRRQEDHDATKWSNEQALGSMAFVGLLTIEAITAEQADAYLSRSPAASTWQKVRSEPAFQNLAHASFTLSLLVDALPTLYRQGAACADLPGLYAAATTAWLLRAGVAKGDISDYELRLQQVATAHLLGMNDGEHPEMSKILDRAGILKEGGQGWSGFRHYTFAEYYLACAIYRATETHSSDILGRVDLIYAYNVNRFLIPMLNRRAAAADSGSENERVAVVTGTQFRRFLKETGWRRKGYGYWRSIAGVDGIIPWETGDPGSLAIAVDGPQDLLGADGVSQNPIGGISWYDAFQYACWVGGRLPTTEEVLAMETENGTPPRLWTGTWHREISALIQVVNRVDDPATPRLEGINPDLRVENLGFAVALHGLGSMTLP